MEEQFSKSDLDHILWENFTKSDIKHIKESQDSFFDTKNKNK